MNSPCMFVFVSCSVFYSYWAKVKGANPIGKLSPFPLLFLLILPLLSSLCLFVFPFLSSPLVTSISSPSLFYYRFKNYTSKAGTCYVFVLQWENEMSRHHDLVFFCCFRWKYVCLFVYITNLERHMLTHIYVLLAFHFDPTHLLFWPSQQSLIRWYYYYYY